MCEFFVTIVNMSISASWIVLAVLMLRLLLKKAPKWINVLLWGIVAVRLICPFSFESVLSLIPSSQTINPETALNSPVIDSGVAIIDNAINPIVGEATISVQPEKDVNLFQFIMPYLAGVWLVGIAALLIYTLISFLRLKSKIGTAVLFRDNIYQSEAVVSPFVLGIIKPKIYLPFNMNGQDMDHVIAHEQAHIRRKDYLWKPLGFLILTLHWFNPLVWLGYILLCRDIELACDEKVVKELNAEQKADYSQALLNCSVNRRMIAACPLAFGEVGVKNRVKSVLNYKKPAFWIIIAAVAASCAAALCFLTNPTKDAGIFTVTDGYTTHGKVGISATELMVGDKTGHIIVKWNNQTDETLSYGEEFHVYRKVSGMKIECKNSNDGWDAILYETQGTDGERTISLNGIEIKSKGKYVLEFDFNVSGDSKDYTAYIEFVGEDDTDDIQGVDNSEHLTWIYNPSLSHTSHYTRAFAVDCEYTHIEATCTGGEFWNLEAEGQPRGTDMRFEKDKTVYWTPVEGDGKSEDKSEVTLIVYNGETKVQHHTVIFERVSQGYGACEYEIYLKETMEFALVYSEDGHLTFVERSSYSDIGGTDGASDIIVSTTIEELKVKYPQFFNVSTDGGLTVYIWQMSKNNYQCYLINRNIDILADQSFAFESGATIAEMRTILTSYDIAQKDIVIHPVNNPLSSYLYEITDEYREKVTELFWSTVPYGSSSEYSPVIDTATFDIDGDGKNEQCSLSYGPTSGLFTFILSVSENGKLEYYNIYNGLAGEMSFETTTAGTKLHLVPQGESEPIDYSFSVRNGNIVLTANGENLAYWGEQGINSAYAPKAISDLNTAIAEALSDKYQPEMPDGLIHIENYCLLASETVSGTPLKGNSGYKEITNVYLLVYYMKYSVNGGSLEEVEGDFVPTAITFAADENGEYTLEDYWTPESGADYEKDVRSKFPDSFATEALNTEKYAGELIKENRRLANEALSEIKGQ